MDFPKTKCWSLPKFCLSLKYGGLWPVTGLYFEDRVYWYDDEGLWGQHDLGRLGKVKNILANEKIGKISKELAKNLEIWNACPRSPLLIKQWTAGTLISFIFLVHCILKIINAQAMSINMMGRAIKLQGHAGPHLGWFNGPFENECAKWPMAPSKPNHWCQQS